MNTLLTFKKETKNTVVYENTEDNAPVPTLYIKKSAFPDGAPDEITLNITEVEE